MGLADFHKKSRAAWVEAITGTVGASPPETSEWTTATSIQNVLSGVVADTKNHALLPTGGGQDIDSVSQSVEKGCIDLMVGRVAYRLKPKRLVLKWIDEHPAESFLLLEADNLAPAIHQNASGSEEVVDLGGGEYIDRSAWDDGHRGYDQSGREIPLPKSARLVVRWLGGKFLLLCKGSLWNGDPGTYDGRHAKMTAEQIREIIERSI